MQFDEDRWSEKHLYEPPPVVRSTPPPPPARGWSMGQRLALGGMLAVLALIAGAVVVSSQSHSRAKAVSSDALGFDSTPTTTDRVPPRSAKAILGALPTAVELHLSRPGAEVAVWRDVLAAAFDPTRPRPADASPCVADAAATGAIRVYALASQGLYGSAQISVSDFGSRSAALAFAKAHVTTPTMSCLQQRYKEELVALTGGGVVSEDSLTEANAFGIASYGIQYSAQFIGNVGPCTQYRHVTWTVVDTAVVMGDFETCYSPYNFQDESQVVAKITERLKSPATTNPGAVIPPTTAHQQSA